MRGYYCVDMMRIRFLGWGGALIPVGLFRRLRSATLLAAILLIGRMAGGGASLASAEDVGVRNPDDVKAMAKALHEADKESKPDILRRLTDVSSDSAHLQEAYAELLDDKDEDVQVAGINIAGKLKMKAAVPKIRKLLHRRRHYRISKEGDLEKANLMDRQYVHQGVAALVELDDFDSLDEIMSRDEFMADDPGVDLAKFGAKVLPKVIQNAGKGWAKKSGACSVIARMRDENAVLTLIELLNGSDEDFSASAAESLMLMGGGTGSKPVRAMIAAQFESKFADKDELVRFRAYAALLKMDPKQYGPQILQAFSKESIQVQGFVLDSISRDPPKGIEEFLEQFIKEDETRHAFNYLRVDAARIIYRATGKKVPYKGLERAQERYRDPYVY